MRRVLCLRALRGLTARSAAPSSLGSVLSSVEQAAVKEGLPQSAAALLQASQGARWSSSGGGGSGGGGGGAPADSGNEAWQAVSRVSAEAQALAEDGDAAGAKALLKKELPALAERYGAEDPAVGVIYNQLALWNFYEGEYEDAAANAEAAHKVWLREQGPDSQAAAYHGIRLGMALAGAGRVEEAFPLLERGLTVAVENYNHHIEQLEGLLPLAEGEEGEAAAAAATPEDEEAMAARAQQQRVSAAMLEQLGRALQEAKFYRALSFLGVSGRQLDEQWEDNGAGAAFFLEQEMSDAISDMLRWVFPDHPTVQCALREHGRLVAQCGKLGLRRLADELQIHHQRLQDTVQEARSGQDGL